MGPEIPSPGDVGQGSGSLLGSAGAAAASYLLPVVGSVIQSQQDAATARENTDKTIAANKELAEYQYSQQLEQWNRSNAYNTPQAQMDRLRAAGLNPNLVYGNGSVVGNTTSPGLPQYQAPRVEYAYKNPVNAMAVLSAFQDIQLKQAQIDNVRAGTNAVNQKTTNDAIRERILGLEEWRGPSINAIAHLKARQMSELEPYFPEVSRETARALGLRNDLAMQHLQLGAKGLTAADLENEKRRADIVYKNLENDWRKMGITSSDHPMIRMLVRSLNEAGVKDFRDIIKRISASGIGSLLNWSPF